MFKILSPEASCGKICPYRHSPESRGFSCSVVKARLGCSYLDNGIRIAQARAREDAKELLESQTSLTILDPLGGPKEAWISIKMPWEDYEAMKKLAQLAD